MIKIYIPALKDVYDLIDPDHSSSIDHRLFCNSIQTNLPSTFSWLTTAVGITLVRIFTEFKIKGEYLNSLTTY